MDMQNIYRDIGERTGGDIYIGVTGPVRTGKSTFIKRFMDLMVIPNIKNQYQKERAMDELPQSGTGKTITTTEPKFIPEEAVEIVVDDDFLCKVRLVDCVGYLVEGALGLLEGEVPRMVSTPWSPNPMSFEQAAEMGTKKVITDHSTIGIVVTTDGTITAIPREAYEQAEMRVVNELKEINKPFVIVLNTVNPSAESAIELKRSMEELYQVPVLPVNCKTIDMTGLEAIINAILKEFPIGQLSFTLPNWVKGLAKEHWLRQEIIRVISEGAQDINKLNDLKSFLDGLQYSPHIKRAIMSSVDAGSGNAKISLDMQDGLFYQIVGEQTGLELTDDRKLMQVLRELVDVRNEYDRFKEAIEEVETSGYGIVTPQLSQLELEQPEIIKQGSRFGVRLKASAPSIHLIKCNVETEIAPLVGTEKQSEELVNYLIKEYEDEPDRIWESDIFGKSLNELVTEGLNNKVFKMPEDSQSKLRETLESMINEGNGGLICIIV